MRGASLKLKSIEDNYNALQDKLTDDSTPQQEVKIIQEQSVKLTELANDISEWRQAWDQRQELKQVLADIKGEVPHP